MKKILLSLSVSILAWLSSSPAIAGEASNLITIFGGSLTEDDVRLPVPKFDNANQFGINYNRSIKSFSRSGFEFNTGFYRHTKEQFHWELTAALMFRYQIFKNRLSFAVGNGLSFASDIPDLERRRHLQTSKLLNLVLIEMAYDVNDFSALAVRWHHRSGIWGLFNGVSGGSNSVQLGTRYKF